MKFAPALVFLLATPVFAQNALPPQTQTEIERLLRHPGIQSGHVGISIQSAEKPQILFEQNAQKRFVPASNMKLLTAGFALHRLGADFRFRTQLLASKVEFLQPNYWPQSVPTPVLLTLVGGNDPSLTTENLREMARAAIGKLGLKAGATAIVRAQNGPNGDALNGENNGNRYPDGWTLDDATWYYGAPVVGLSVNRNQVDVTVSGGEKIGDPASVQTSPDAPFEVQNLVTTAQNAAGVSFDRGTSQNALSDALILGGQIGVGEKRSEGVAVLNPREWARQIFIAELQKAEIAVVDPKVAFASGEQTPVVVQESAPLGELLKRFLKSSDNLYGELILRRAGWGEAPAFPQFFAPEKRAKVVSMGAANRAHQKMANWLLTNHLEIANLRFSDGSGLSRYNLLTPRAVSDFLRLMNGQKDAAVFYDALPIAGVDGTLKNRMKNSAAQGNARAKTGTFSIVNCLSGYVTTRDGKRLAVSILTNGVEDGELARRWQGRVFATLAGARLAPQGR